MEAILAHKHVSGRQLCSSSGQVRRISDILLLIFLHVISSSIQMHDQLSVSEDSRVCEHVHAGQHGHRGQGGGLRLPLRDDPRLREPRVRGDDGLHAGQRLSAPVPGGRALCGQRQ